MLRVGVLGCSDIAWRRALPALVAEPRVELVAVASRDAAKAGRFAERFGCAAVEGYRKLVERDDLDAVYVPLPVALHAEWVGAALERGRHVLAEKPLTTDLESARRLTELASARGLLLLENFMFLFHSQHDAVRKLVADGAIGEPRGFSATFTIPPLPAGDIRYRPELGGGCLLDVGGYPIRAAQLFLGGELAVAGASLVADAERGVDVAGAALLHTPDGVSAQLCFGMRHAYRSRYELWGSEGRIALDRAFTPPAEHRPLLVVDRQGAREEVILPADDQWANVVRSFAEAALGGTALDSYARSTLRQAALVDNIRRAAAGGR